MCNFFQKYEFSKYREKSLGYPYPYPVPVWKDFLDIRIQLQTDYPAGHATGKPDSDHLWTDTDFFRFLLRSVTKTKINFFWNENVFLYKTFAKRKCFLNESKIVFVFEKKRF